MLRESLLGDFNIMEVKCILQFLNVAQQQFHVTLEETNTHSIEKAQCLKFQKKKNQQLPRPISKTNNDLQ